MTGVVDRARRAGASSCGDRQTRPPAYSGRSSDGGRSKWPCRPAFDALDSPLKRFATQSNRHSLSVYVDFAYFFTKSRFDFFASRALEPRRHVVRQRARASRAPGAVDLLPKQAVHKPFRPHRLATPQALAIEPEAAAFGILGAEIVARRRSRVSPPGRGDALRPLDGRDIMQDSPPAETQRRAIRHFGERLDRLRAGEKAQRPRRGGLYNRRGLLPAQPRFPQRGGRGRLRLLTQV